MASDMRRQKLLYIAKLLYEQTDEEHGVTLKEIADCLERQGIPCERKAVYLDLEALRGFGLDIELVHRKQFEYRLVSRTFQLAELKLLVNAVESSKFITKKKSIELIKKLESLASKQQARELHRTVYVDGRVKNMNESIYYTVDTVHSAVARDKKLEFKYFDYSRDKKRVLRHDGFTYVVSPLALTFSQDNCYLFAYTPAHDEVRTYRVDKMKDAAVSEFSREIPERFRDFDPARAAAVRFDMFSGERTRVTLSFPDRLSSMVVDRFGIDCIMVPLDDGHFTVTIDVAVSPTFFGWVAGFGGEVVILSPASTARRYLEALGRALDAARG